MTELTLDDMLAQFAEDVRPKVLGALNNVSGIAVYRNGDVVKALALTDDVEPVLGDGSTLVGIYRNPTLDTPLSRTQQALNYLKENDVTPYAAARHFQLDPQAVYRAVKRAAQNRCPCCGQTMRKR